MKQFNIKTYETQIREYIKNKNYRDFTIAEMVSDLDIDMVGMPESDEFYKAEREIRLLSNSIKREGIITRCEHNTNISLDQCEECN